MAMHVSIRAATRSDLPRMEALLTANRQSTHALLVEGSRYWLAETANREIVGVIGVETE
jgi:N-acetylglutamate synthase-like GNAT family acetyltransferase